MVKPSMKEWRQANAARPSASRLVLFAQMLWIILSLLAVGRAALYHLSSAHRGSYAVFANAGRHWLHGEAVYDSANVDSLTVFRYSPLTAVTCVPYGLLPDPVGSALLRAVNVAVFGIGFWCWCRTLLPGPENRDRRALAWLLCLGMGFVSMMEVQFNLLTIGFILLALAAVSTERWTSAGLAISLACCLKVYPVALALVLVVIHPRRFVGPLLMAMFLCLTLPFLCQQSGYVWRQYGDWMAWGLNQRLPQEGLGFQDFKLICKLYWLPIAHQTYQLLEVASGAAIAGICLFRRRQGMPAHDLVPIVGGLCCAWMMVFGPATESLTYIQLAPIVALSTVMAWSTSSRIWFRALIGSAALLLTLCQVQLLFPLHRPLHYVAAQPIAALLFMIALSLKAPRGTAPSAAPREATMAESTQAPKLDPLYDPDHVFQTAGSAR